MVAVDVDKRITAREIKEHEVYEDVRWDLVQKKNKKSGIGKVHIYASKNSKNLFIPAGSFLDCIYFSYLY
jgi:hypothetical protein